MFYFILLLATVWQIDAYSVNPAETFVPYDNGLTGRYGDPLTTSRMQTVNEGAAGTQDYPRLYTGPPHTQMCPGRVGPFEDGQYYCLGKENGYCDTRSGTCFCNVGYKGLACEACSETHYPEGLLCYPKLVCPNDCSGAGKCIYQTGVCDCEEHRKGDDCSEPFCEFLHSDPLCKECTSSGCTRCLQGYFLDATNRCTACSSYDPRCTACDSTGCLECTDLLLSSSRRSGLRYYDTELPPDEISRVLEHELPFGTQDPTYFRDAENYRLVSTAAAPLHAAAQQCDQGLVTFNANWDCTPIPISHVVCGHEGVLTLSSPLYETPETGIDGSGTIRITALRTGGGYGDVSFTYNIQHVSTNSSDVTDHSQRYHTLHNTVTMAAGVVQASWLLTIHDDTETEGDEEFQIHLSDPTGGLQLGGRVRASVFIRDDDGPPRAQPRMTTVTPDAVTGDGVSRAIAGVPTTITIASTDAAGDPQSPPNDGAMYIAVIRSSDVALDNTDIRTPMQPVQVVAVHAAAESYTATYTVTQAGAQSLSVYKATRGGLRGHYYSSAYMGAGSQHPIVTRIDRNIDWNWHKGPVASGASEHVSATWHGKLQPAFTELYTFTVLTEAEGYVELWIDGALLYEGLGGGLGASHLTADHLHTIDFKYRHAIGDAIIQLQWASPSQPTEVVPAAAFYYLDDVQGSPFELTVVSGVTSPLTTQAHGPGTVSAVVGEESTFTIVARDAYGNLRGTDGADVTADDMISGVLVVETDTGLGGGNHQVACHIEYDATSRTHVARYTPLVSGIHKLHITHVTHAWTDVTPIRNSPYTVTVAPGPAFARNCKCSGPLVAGTTVAGVVATFTITAHDTFFNLRLIGGEAFEVRMYHASQPLIVESIIVDNMDGSYGVSIQPWVSGSYKLAVTLHGEHVHSSPYSITVSPAQGHGPASTSTGAALTTATATAANVITVQARDAFGNALWSTAGEILTASVVDPAVKAAVVVASSDSSGTYTVTYNPDTAGINTLQIRLNGVDVLGSPFSVDVHGGLSTGDSTVNGVSLTKATAGKLATFEITARDDMSNPTTMTGTSPYYSVGITGVGGTYAGTVAATAVKGVFEASYNVTVAGSYDLTVTDLRSAEAVTGSPYALVVSPNYAFAPETQVTIGREVPGGNAITLQAHDLWGNSIAKGGELVETTWEPVRDESLLINAHTRTLVSSTDDIDETTITSGARDNADGTYTAISTGVPAGDYNLSTYVIETGGLWGSYYHQADFKRLERVRYTKSEVNFNWGKFGPGSTASTVPEPVVTTEAASAPLPSDAFSVKFEGLLLPDRSEEHTLYVTTDPSSAVQLTISGEVLIRFDTAADAKPVTKQAYTVRSASLKLTKGVMVPITLLYTHGKDEALIKLEWQSFSDLPRQIIPSKNLLHKRYGGSVVATVWPDTAHSRSSTAVGESLITAKAGELQTFTVTVRDRHGNSHWSGGAAVTVYAQAAGGSGMIYGDVTDNQDGTYAVEYSAIVAGRYVLNVLVNAAPQLAQLDLGYTTMAQLVADQHIVGSPFSLAVTAGATSAGSCVLYGDGLIEPVAGGSLHGGASTLQTFTIRARDVHGNRVTSGSDVFIAELTSLFMPQRVLPVTIKYTTAGEYAASYNATKAGRYELTVTLGGETVGDSSLVVTVIPAAANASTTTCDNCYQGLVVSPLQAGLAKTLYITTRDKWGNSLLTGGTEFYVHIKSLTGILGLQPALVPVTDHGDGTYSFNLGLLLSIGPHVLSIMLADRFIPASGAFGGGGVTAQYYTDTRMTGAPHTTRVDAGIDFNWGTSTIGASPAVDNAAVRWTGYLKSHVQETVTFTLEADDYATLWIDDVQVISTRSGLTKTGSYPLAREVLHKIRVDYVELTGAAKCALYYSSTSIQYQPVPSFLLYPAAQHITSSPFSAIVV